MTKKYQTFDDYMNGVKEIKHTLAKEGIDKPEVRQRAVRDIGSLVNSLGKVEMDGCAGDKTEIYGVALKVYQRLIHAYETEKKR